MLSHQIMGLPTEWVTDSDELTHGPADHRTRNGVLPLQAPAAIRSLGEAELPVSDRVVGSGLSC